METMLEDTSNIISILIIIYSDYENLAMKIIIYALLAANQYIIGLDIMHVKRYNNW